MKKGRISRLSPLERLPFACALVLLLCNSIAQPTQSGDVPTCGHKPAGKFAELSEELNESSLISSGSTDTPQSCLTSRGHHKLSEEVKGQQQMYESGVDFLRAEFDLEFDEDLFVGNNDLATERQSKLTLLEIVQKFIRNVKGVPSEFSLGYMIVSGSRHQEKEKPAWCFHPHLLKKLAAVEIAIYKILKRFYYSPENKELELVLPALESYLKDIEESSLRAFRHVSNSNLNTNSSEDPFMYIGTHPLLIYRMVRRFAEDLQPILSEVDMYEDLIAELYEANPELLVFPTFEDVIDALQSLVRIQRDSDLKTDEFARGKLENIETDINLNALHALELGAYWNQDEKFDYAVQWTNLALETVRKSPAIKLYPVIEKFFSKCFHHAVESHNDNWLKFRSNLWYHGVFTTKITLPYNPEAYVRTHDALKQNATRLKNISDWNWAVRKNFIQVCSGANLKSEQEKAILKCWDQRSVNPYWLINPLKVEVLNLEPPVVQIYDFIGENMMTKIKELTISGLQRSTVVDRNDHTRSVVDSTRTSSQVWVYEANEDGRFTQALSRRLELMSNLIIMPSSASDAYQVANYGPSHHYAAHIDSFEDPRRCVVKGNRITTIMGYLSTTTAGGRTGFPVLGVAAEPIKGSIVMWNNLMRNGHDRDMRTWHGGCPVILGEKWISNKWIYYKDNFLRYKCELDPSK